MTWQPPIPAGALYSPDATALGTGLALLAWCYDRIDRTGWVEVHLDAAAQDIGLPYGTIRDWWRALRSSALVAELVDCGRRGWRMRLHPEWVDWRIMEQNYPAREGDTPPASPWGERRNSNGETTERALTVASPWGERRNSNGGGDVYMVLHDDQTCCAVVASDDAPPPHGSPPDAPPPPGRAPRAKPAHPPTPLEVRQALAAGCQIDLATGLKADILQVNRFAAHLWQHMRRPDQSVDQFVALIRTTGSWIRKTQHPYRESEQRIPPAALVKFWAAASAARERTAPRPPPIPVAPPGPLLTPQELAVHARAADERRRLAQG